MNTPSSSMSNRRKRRSSILNSPNDSSILFKTNQNVSSLVGLSTPDSISKIKKQNLTKDLLRKQQQYKTRKLKRAELIEKNRNLSNEDDQNDLNELDENYYDNFNTEDYEHSNPKMLKLDIKDEKIEIKQEQIDQSYIDRKPSIKIETNKKTTTTTSIGSSIINRIASIKNTFKSIVNYGQSSNSTKLAQPVTIKSKQNQTKTINNNINNNVNTTTVQNNKNKNVIKILNQNNLKKHDIIMHRSSSTSNIKHAASKLNNNYNSNTNLKTNANVNINNRLKKQESTSSCKFLKSSSHLATTSTSSLKSQMGRTMCSKENLYPNRPVFKITKIKYDDRHLFDTGSCNSLCSIDKNKYYKLITNRKIALSNMGSTHSLT